MSMYCDIIATEYLQNELCRGSLITDFQSKAYLAILQLLIDEWITPN